MGLARCERLADRDVMLWAFIVLAPGRGNAADRTPLLGWLPTRYAQDLLGWGLAMRLALTIAGIATLICSTLLGILPGHAEKRIALVIGNSVYQHADKLANPVTDARAMRDALVKLGFEVVYGENLGKQQLELKIGSFADAVHDADVALVYFAGHGATFGDVPYVVPVDAQFSSLGQMPYVLVPVETLIGELRQAKGLRIVILDACRDNAAERELKRAASRGGEITRGLARVNNPEGLILAYATQYLSTAADGAPNGDSPFTTALLHNIATPGLDVKDLFFRVGREVTASTMGRQRPEISISFYDSYALVPGTTAAAAPAVAPPSVDAQARACAEERGARSIEATHPTLLQFNNKGRSPVRIYWIDYTGQRQFRSELLVGQFWVEHTFMTHPFVVTDQGGHCLAVYMPAVTPARVSIP